MLVFERDFQSVVNSLKISKSYSFCRNGGADLSSHWTVSRWKIAVTCCFYAETVWFDSTSCKTKKIQPVKNDKLNPRYGNKWQCFCKFASGSIFRKIVTIHYHNGFSIFKTTCHQYTVCPPVYQMYFIALWTFRKRVDAGWLQSFFSSCVNAQIITICHWTSVTGSLNRVETSSGRKQLRCWLPGEIRTAICQASLRGRSITEHEPEKWEALCWFDTGLFPAKKWRGICFLRLFCRFTCFTAKWLPRLLISSFYQLKCRFWLSFLPRSLSFWDLWTWPRSVLPDSLPWCRDFLPHWRWSSLPRQVQLW